jgi:hypothetical protein
VKTLVTGGNRGLGKVLCEVLSADSISRENGYDIKTAYDEIAIKSLDYDVFINNAFDGPPQEEWANFGQFQVLNCVYELWKENKKNGLIIGSVGSKNVVAPEPSFETYRVAKQALEFHSKQCTAAFKNNLVKFKTTLITLDRLDTPLSRNRTTWTGNGINCDNIASYIKFLMTLEENTCVEEIIFYVNFNYDQK